MSTKIESRAMPDSVVKSAAMAMAMGDLVIGDMKGFHSPVSERRFALLLGDVMMAILATGLVLLGLGAMDGASTAMDYLTAYWYWLPVMVSLWVGLGWLNDLYHIASSHDHRRVTQGVVLTSVMGLGLFFALSWIVPFVPPFGFVAAAWGMTSVGIFAWRNLYLTLSDAFLPFDQRVLVIGRGARAKVITDVLKENETPHYFVAGYVEDPADVGLQWKDDLPTLGEIYELSDVAQLNNIHQVIVATEGPVSEELFSALVNCQANGVPVAWMPDAYEKLLHRIPVEYIDPAWGLFAVQGKPIFRRLQLASKRILDLSIFILALPIFAIVVPLLAVAIKLDSKGPVFYNQIRAGRGGQPFTIYKFRTMVTDAEKNGAQWAQKNDTRITRVGRFLRKTRLDELPQIINVFRGEMSFVGPRPERPEFVAELSEQIPFFSTRMLVKPGLTGWAQIHYDYGNTVEDARMKLEYDFYYVRYWSIWMDIYTLFRTIAVVAMFKGM